MAAALRAVVFLLPLLAAIALVRLVGAALPAPAGFAGWVVWLFATAVVALATVTVVERFARRLLPLVALLKMSLVFPDETPSRMRIALRRGTARDLQRRLAEGESLGTTAGEAAENLLVLLGRLNDHDRLTRGHSERVRAYADLIGEELGLSADDRSRLHWAALAHDLGKLTVPPEILNKDGRPTEEEWQVLRGHPGAAEAIVAPLRPWLGDWLAAATQHHERWDGAGYPRGLSAEQIHPAGRIVAVADAFDTMTSARSYKKPLSMAAAREELTRNAGSQFDPEAVRALMAVGVGRLRLVAGPLSWLASLPTASGVAGVGASGGAAAAAGNLVGAVAVVAAASGLGATPRETEPVEGVEVARVIAAGDAVDPSGDPEPQATLPGPRSSTAPEPTPTSPVPSTTTTVSPTSTAPVGPSGPSPTAPGSTPPSSVPAPSTTAAPPSTSVSPTTTSSSTTTTTTVSTTTTTTVSTTTTTTTTTTVPPGLGLDCLAVQGGLRPLAGLDLVNCDLQGFDFSGQNLDDADLTGANLAGSNLAGASMKDGNFDAVNFTGALLAGTDMRFSNWDESNFSGAVLRGANLRNSNAEFVDFTSADLTTAKLGNTGVKGSDFTNADLTGAGGTPNDGPTAIWSNTTCPDGTVQSSSCYP